MTEYDHKEKLLRQQEAIRRSGAINMFDKSGVASIARDMGFDELAEFIDSSDASSYFDLAEEARVYGDENM